MAVVIRMKRVGRKNRPAYRISVADARAPRDGRTLEALGHYNPLMPREEHQISLDVERARFWVMKGALVSETVGSIFRRLGVYEGEAKKVKEKRDRSGRKQTTKTGAARVAAKDARAAAKSQRHTQRVAAKRTAAKAAAAAKAAGAGEEAKS